MRSLRPDAIRLLPPPLPGRPSQVEPAEQPGAPRRRELDGLLPFARFRPGECPSREALGDQPQPRAVRVEDLDDVPPTAAEHEQVAAPRVSLEYGLRGRRERVEAFPH